MPFFDTTTLRSLLHDLSGEQAPRLQRLRLGPIGLELIHRALADLESAEGARDDALPDDVRREARSLAAVYKSHALAADNALTVLGEDPLIEADVSAAARQVSAKLFGEEPVRRAALASLLGHSERARLRAHDVQGQLEQLPALGASWSTRVESWLEVGDLLTMMLRSERTNPAERGSLRDARLAANSVLHRVRNAVIAEVRLDPELEESLAASIFARYDEIKAIRGRRRPRGAVPSPSTEEAIAPVAASEEVVPASESALEPEPANSSPESSEAPTGSSVLSSITAAAEDLADAAEDLAEAADDLNSAA